MTELEKWLANLIKQKSQDETDWFLNRPSLRQAREKELTDLA
jgi:hypothetical protein